jgi:type II secretory pathway component PulK
MRTPTDRAERGVVLLVVLFFVLLLVAAIATFLRRVAIDAGVATHRDRALEAEALARGGVRIGQALLLEDLRLAAGGAPTDSQHSVWARVAGVDLIEDPDVSLTLDIEDAAARINLNGFLDPNGAVIPAGRDFLEQLLSNVIDTLPGRPEDKHYDPAELADNLIDWIDKDDVRISGGLEAEVYSKRDPPVVPPNRPLLSVDELRLVEGFDGPLVEALRPYVGVYPLGGGGTINLNTAPSWVLAQLTRGGAVGGYRPIEEETVKRILDAREKGLVCASATEVNGCTTLADLFGGETIEPAASSGSSSVFRVVARARVVDVERSIEAVIDRSKPSEPLRLSWRVD